MTIDKKFRVSGENEKNIRLFLTELFSRVYKGRCQIFDQSKDGHIQEKQMTLEDGKMTIHQRISLQHYLHITNLRIKQ